MSKLAYYIKAALPALLFFVSCGRNGTALFAPSALTQTTVSDTTSLWHKVMSQYSDLEDGGSIAIFGGPDETAVLTEAFVTCDIFDNIDGILQPDGLADFAGETLMPIFDVANAPYHGYFDSMNEGYVKEVAVKGFLTAVSGHCSTSSFDYSRKNDMPAAKVMILSSSVLAECGYQDILHIVGAFDKEIAVISPVYSSVYHLLCQAIQPSNAAVWAQNSIISSGVYARVFHELTEGDNQPVARDEDGKSLTKEIVCLSPEMGSNPQENAMAFLEAYADAQYETPLSAVIVDDMCRSAMVDSLNVAVAAILLSDSEEAERCRKVMAPGFRFISPAEMVVTETYRWLRSHDRFTHRVALPAVTALVSVVSSDVTTQNLDADGMLVDEYKYLRQVDSDMETFRFVPLSQSGMGRLLSDKLETVAPETFKKLTYVY